MKVLGIIAEFNPFHNGHQYLIREARRLTGADYCIAVMSGDFVQRGGPALIDKYTRTACALEDGCDLVLELPVAAVCLNADYFARFGVNILNRLGVVTDLAFGCEADESEFPLLFRLAQLFFIQPPAFRQAVSSAARRGLTYPAARSRAASEILKKEGFPPEKTASVLASPNNILAIEYLKAMQMSHSAMLPCPVMRTGSRHDSPVLDIPDKNVPGYASASAIRRYFLHENNINENLLCRFLPESSLHTLLDQKKSGFLTQADDFSLLLHYAILRELNPAFRKSETADSDLLLRIRNHAEAFTGWGSFAALIKSRNLTLTAVNRQLSRLLLDIDERKYLPIADEVSCAPYARILGFRRQAAPLLKKIRKHSAIPVVTSAGRSLRTLSAPAASLLEKDVYAADLRNCVLTGRTGIPRSNDLRRPLVITE